jgi:predicted nucleotidyltransferase component of viral defense system
MNETNVPFPHDADLDIFREALAYSEATTGFTASLIEKDYYCSLVLQHFFDSNTSLVFKGGTCLSKIYADFYRLSEDLDFIIPVPVDTSRNQRRSEIEPVKAMFDGLPAVVPGVAVSEAFKGHNESRQYIGSFEYESAIIDKHERIILEIGLREPLLSPSVSMATRTIVVNPFSGRPLLPSFTVRAMSEMEAYAEKVRAALSRKKPAIRDFFDLYYAVRQMGLDVHNPDFLRIVKAKFEVPGNPPVEVSADRKRELNRQLEGQLKPVLRPPNFASFNLDEAFELVCGIADVISI